ncbi:MAG: hypothetical protein IAX21_03645 [Candidatus Bathyarchaeota archaeon]|nr:MAG: hypothetical protein IAX21_03645 [Candidatus Bathyarchaeota archaeon]
MEPEVHIVERYMQFVKKCLTMTNIMLGGGKELDILAYNPRTSKKYHIEVRVATGKGFNLRMKDTQTKDGRKHRRGMDTLNEIKFIHPIVTNKVTKIFGSSDYKKVLVVWDMEDKTIIEQAKNVYDIELWKISDILNDMLNKIGTKPYRDDALRIIQLIAKMDS